MIAHTSKGIGSPVVLLPSGGMTGRQWRKLADELETKHRVLSVDTLGTGGNPRWPDDRAFDFQLDVDAICELLESLGEPVHLVGHSYGGLIALTLGRLYPTLVRSLSLYEPVAFGVLYATDDREGIDDLEQLRTALDKPDSELGTAEWFEPFIDYWSGAGTWANSPPAMREAFLSTGTIVGRQVRSLTADRTAAAAYATLAVPTLLLGGEHSPAAERRVLAHLTAALPRVTTAILPEVGHMGPLSHTTTVNAAIVRHIAAN